MPKQKHVIILRRIDAQCSFGLKYLTHPRPMTDAEIMEEAKKVDEINQFGHYNVFYKLYNKEVGACFYFENQETDK